MRGWVDDLRATFEAGETQLDAALALSPNDPLTFYYVGCAHIYTGRHETAIRFLEASLAEN